MDLQVILYERGAKTGGDREVSLLGIDLSSLEMLLYSGSDRRYRGKCSFFGESGRCDFAVWELIWGFGF